VYIERLIENKNIVIYPENWARIVVGAVMLSSKVWDDHAIWNVDFCQVFPDVAVTDL
jgi:hypothetical protein